MDLEGVATFEKRDGRSDLMKRNNLPAIEVSGLTVVYDDLVALENVNLTVMEGDFFGIIGPNGGGKTTLLKSMAGLINPVKGHIRIFGLPPSEAGTLIGYVPQYADYDRAYPISVEEVVLMGRRRCRGRKPFYSREDREEAERALELLEIIDLRDRKISDLSGGQRQRVYLARAIVSRPRILLLDEPTASIDKKIQSNFYDFLKRLNREVTIVMVTHDIGVVSSYVNKIACLNRRIYTHEDRLITKEMLEESYQCPVELIAHGIPHRVFAEHNE